MAFTYLTNQTPINGSVAMFNFKTTMKTAGWVVTSSSDGTTYNAAGDQITTSASGAGGMANTNAWFVLQHPTLASTQRSFCVQRSNSALNWRIKFSQNAGFTGGSPGAARVPSATDEQVQLGGGTDASPTFVAMFSTDGTYRQQVFAGDAANEGYSFFLLTWTSLGTVLATIWCMEQLASGSYPSGDLDPYCYWLNTGSNQFGANGQFYQTGVNVGPSAYYKFGLTGQAFQPLAAQWYAYAGNNPIYVALGTNAHTSNDDLLPVFYSRHLTNSILWPGGLKGQSKYFSILGASRSFGDTISVASAGAKDRIVLGTCSLVWDGSTPTI